MRSNKLTELLGLRHPILQAPMAGVAGGVLAGAVSASGGLGMIGGGYGDPDWVRTEMGLVDPATIGVGFITWKLPDPPLVLEWVLKQRPRAVFLSFGNPAPYVAAIKAAGAKLICQIQTVEAAREAAGAGADVIVAQGTEAGGHGGERATLSLVPAVVDAVGPLPVVAAGGIADGRGVAAALMLGADGVMLGTRFLASTESLLHQRGKARLVESTGDQTLRTRVFDLIRGHDWPQPYLGRVLVNRFTDLWQGREEALAEQMESASSAYGRSVAAGDFDQAVLFSGEGVDLIQAVAPAERIMERLLDEAATALRKGVERLEP